MLCNTPRNANQQVQQSIGAFCISTQDKEVLMKYFKVLNEMFSLD